MADDSTAFIWDIAGEFQAHKAISLRGPWEFFPAQLLEPGDQQGSPYTAWTGKVWGEDEKNAGMDPRQGYASYRLRIKGFRAEAEGYQVALRSASSSYKAYLYPEQRPEAALVFQNGKVSQEKAYALPFMLPRVVSFKPHEPDEIWVLLVQVSNYHYGRSGLWVSPELSPGNYLSRSYQFEHDSYLLAIAVLMVMGLYNLAFYLRRPDDKASLFLFGFCFVTGLRAVAAGYLLAYYAHEPTLFAYQLKCWLEYAAVLLGPAFFLAFLNSTFPRQIPRFILMIQVLVGGLGLIAIILLPAILYTRTLLPFQIVALLNSCTAFFILSRAIYKKSSGAWYATGGAVILVFTMFYDICVAAGWFPYPYVSQFGNCFFIFMQSQVIAKRFALAFQTAERLQENLAIEVDRQTRSIRSILDTIEQGLLIIQSDLRIHHDYSRHLETIYAGQDIKGAPALFLLLGSSNCDKELVSQVESILTASFEEEILCWELNEAHLPREIEVFFPPAQHMTLEIEWTPMLNQNKTVEQILVTVRDVSAMRELVSHKQKQDEDMKMIEELLAIKPAHFYRFYRQSEQMLQQCRLVLQNDDMPWRVLCEQLLVYYHTLKGSARGHSLKSFTSLLHNAEDDICQIIKQISPDRQILCQLTDRIQAALLRYVKLEQDKLSRKPSTGEEDKLQELDISLIRRLFISAAKEADRMPHDQQTWSEFVHLIGPKIFIRIDDFIEDLSQEAAILAEQLQKPKPKVRSSCSSMWLHPEADHSLRLALVHILRNTLDHGIELPLERLQKGKTQFGHLDIDMRFQDGKWVFCIGDDGQGLDLEQILTKARKLGIVDSEAILTDNQVANLIFVSEFSTARELTDLSGRGIGMGAVRKILSEIGAEVAIILLEKSQVWEACCPFVLEIALPVEAVLDFKFNASAGAYG